MNSYWNETGKYQKAYTEFWAKLVPYEGPSLFVEGENLRAATKIYWDYNNNGFGCNNWSGAFNWLVKQEIISSQERQILGPYATGDEVVHRTADSYTEKDPISLAIETLMDRVLENILAKNFPVDFTANTDDMLNHTTREIPYGYGSRRSWRYAADEDENND